MFIRRLRGSDAWVAKCNELLMEDVRYYTVKKALNNQPLPLIIFEYTREGLIRAE